ncbi:hypothetical protein J4457_04800 [Candidatus Woesearchaeota archaeon]|nr:hypothetical protein [Candidatus Woesearchaeota archaeon]
MDDENQGLWSKGSFVETTSPAETEKKMRTFHMKHDEEMDYNCKKCNVKISAHNKDWHDNMCDGCFNGTYFPDEESDTE